MALPIRAIVLPPMTTLDADGPRLMDVPKIMTAWAPGMMVWLPNHVLRSAIGKNEFSSECKIKRRVIVREFGLALAERLESRLFNQMTCALLLEPRQLPMSLEEICSQH